MDHLAYLTLETTALVQTIGKNEEVQARELYGQIFRKIPLVVNMDKGLEGSKREAGKLGRNHIDMA